MAETLSHANKNLTNPGVLSRFLLGGLDEQQQNPRPSTSGFAQVGKTYDGLG